MRSLPSITCIGFVALVGFFTAISSHGASRQVIWNFDDSLTDMLGGGYNVFGRSPSWARTYLDPRVHLPNTRHSLRVTAHRAASGFCGVWFDFYPETTPRRYFDAHDFRYLTFWIKGTPSLWDFDLKLVDETGESHEDSLETQPLDAYLPHGITTAWQKVEIPLADFPEIDPGSLARFVLMFNTAGNYKFYLDDIALETHRTHGSVQAVTGTPRALPNARSVPNAMWVWNTDELFNGRRQPKEFFAFCGRMKVRTIYLSLDLRQSAAGVPLALQNTARYDKLLQQAHEAKLRVEALAGSPEWAVSQFHPRAVDVVKIVAHFNRAAPSNGRFDGVHLDVEPYVLIGFADSAFRKLLLRDYLAMVAECEAQARKDDLGFSCDVPWWFFPATEAARQAMTVNFAGTSETVGAHLLALLHSVTIMDYRNEADGAAGIIAFGEPALAEAARRHRKIVIGLETSAEKPASVDFVLAVPVKSFSRLLGHSRLYGQRSFEGYGLFALRGGETIFVGLGPPLQGMPPAPEPMETALKDMRRSFGAKAGMFRVRPFLPQARAAVAENPEWTQFSDYRLNVHGRDGRIQGFQAIHRTAPEITFHGLGRRVFEEETRSVVEWLGPSPAFAGLAFHYYDSLRELMAHP